MPITQERMQDLISVSQSLFDNADRARKTAAAFEPLVMETRDIETLRGYAEELCNALSTFGIIDPSLIQAFFREKEHFKFNERQNRSRRDAMRRQRLRRNVGRETESKSPRPDSPDRQLSTKELEQIAEIEQKLWNQKTPAAAKLDDEIFDRNGNLKQG